MTPFTNCLKRLFSDGMIYVHIFDYNRVFYQYNQVSVIFQTVCLKTGFVYFIWITGHIGFHPPPHMVFKYVFPPLPF